MRMSAVVVVMGLAVSIATPQLGAQTHVTPQSVLDAALDEHVRGAERQREDVLRVLQHPDVQGAAARAGVDLQQAANAVRTLDGADLATVAARAQQVETALAGGQSRITVSTTLIIIGLLLLILIIVIAT